MMATKDGLRKYIENKKMPNGKLFSECSRVELYDIITEAMNFITQQNIELSDCKQRLELLAEIKKRKEQSTLLFKIKSLFNAK